MSKIIPSAEVKNHKRKNDLWMIIHNEVYDVSKFVDEHPGGVDTLLDLAGQDATEAFEDVGHSADARALLKKYKIGTLPPDEQTKNSGTCTTDKKKYLLIAAAAIAIIVIAVVAKKRME